VQPGTHLAEQARCPFSEKLLKTQEEIDTFYKMSGSNGAPTLSIGKNYLSGFLESRWNSELDVAGYPKTASYRNASHRSASALHHLPLRTGALQPNQSRNEACYMNVNSLKVRLPHALKWLAANLLMCCACRRPNSRMRIFRRSIAGCGYHSVFSGQKTYNGVAILSANRHVMSSTASPVMQMNRSASLQPLSVIFA